MQLVRAVLLASCLLGCASANNEPRDDSGMSRVDSRSSTGDGPSDGSGTSCATPYSGTLASWTFVGEAGNQTSTAAASTAGGAIAGAIRRGAGLTAASGAGSINSSNWATGAAVDATKHYAFTIAPPPGCTLSLTQLAIDAKASGTGPASGAIATSADSFAQTTAVSTAAPATVMIVIADTTATVEVRVSGYGATSASGTLRLQNTLSLAGAIE